MYISICPEKNQKIKKSPEKNCYPSENLAIGAFVTPKKEKNTKKIEKNKQSTIGEKPGNRHHGSKKKKRESCQEGENLVNRCLLFPMLHLAVHLLAILYSHFHAFAFLLPTHVSMD